MFMEHGAVELIFLAAIALIVVGPKDLPVLMRKVGQFTAKLRGMAAEFRASFEELAQQSELDQLRQEVEDLRRHHYTQHVIEPVETYVRDLHADVQDDLSEGDIAPALLPSAQSAASAPDVIAETGAAPAVEERKA